jgi:hypothetical protein
MQAVKNIKRQEFSKKEIDLFNKIASANIGQASKQLGVIIGDKNAFHNTSAIPVITTWEIKYELRNLLPQFFQELLLQKENIHEKIFFLIPLEKIVTEKRFHFDKWRGESIVNYVKKIKDDDTVIQTLFMIHSGDSAKALGDFAPKRAALILETMKAKEDSETKIFAIVNDLDVDKIVPIINHANLSADFIFGIVDPAKTSVILDKVLEDKAVEILDSISENQIGNRVNFHGYVSAFNSELDYVSHKIDSARKAFILKNIKESTLIKILNHSEFLDKESIRIFFDMDENKQKRVLSSIKKERKIFISEKIKEIKK